MPSSEKVGIDIYARVKPVKKTHHGVLVDRDMQDNPRIAFSIPRSESAGFVNNKKENYKFRFKHIFPQDCSQEDVFGVVAQPVIDSVVDGYNGTIFAYGQTGSGKTFTITGGAERYADRGIIPRTLSYVFDQVRSQTDREFTIKISYLEIYNDEGYDLLDPNHEITKMEDLPKVTIMDDGDGDYHLQHLSQNVVTNEEDALNALFIGDTNRMIAETPMNQASTRSHCIFSIYISSRAQGESVIRRAKLHLVDLAGSERIGKTGVVGNLATEAKYINLSLHYLEQVIVALGERSRTHIPYRNSMMTSVLRDSLGGNCKTTMIATLNTMTTNIDESVSTCRFAQRVALIKNSAMLNEETDPAAMVAQLREEVARLKAELALATGGGDETTGPLSAAELLRCREMVDEYLGDATGKASLMLGDMRKIQECFRLLKERGGGGGDGGMAAISPSPSQAALMPPTLDHGAGGGGGGGGGGGVDPEEVRLLEDTLRQRDNEISILVAKLKKERAKGKGNGGGSSSRGSVSSDGGGGGGYHNEQQRQQHHHHGSQPPPPTLPSSSSAAAASQPSPRRSAAVPVVPPDRAEAFEFFRQSHPDRDSIVENRRRLKELSTQAKALGGQVNSARTAINTLKGQIQKARLASGVAGLVDGGSAPIDMSVEEAGLRRALEEEKMQYKSKITGLKSFKKEIEHLQHLLEMAKVKLHRDFDSWTRDQQQAGGQSQHAPPPSADGQYSAYQNQDEQRVQKAWGTPPLSPIGKGAAAAAGGGGGHANGYANQYQAAPVAAPVYGGGSGGVQQQYSGQQQQQYGGQQQQQYGAAAAPPAEYAAYAPTQQSYAAPPLSGNVGGGGGGAEPVEDDIAAFFAARDAMRNR